MRRLKILFFWIFASKNNINISELLRFLTKPKVDTIAKKFIKAIDEKTGDYEVVFHPISKKLHWPKTFSMATLYQIVAETFDKQDWHYYQKRHTQIADGEILLDIGTAEGLFPLTVIDKCQKIYMVEPSEIFQACLKKTFAAHTDKIEIFHTAIGNEDGTIYFEENSLEGTVSHESSAGKNKINIQKVDTLFSNNEKITYLKADIEGFEEEMLRGAEQTIKANKPRIAITCYHTQNNPEEIISIIKGFVPEYKHYVKGIYGLTPKPVMIHFWL